MTEVRFFTGTAYRRVMHMEIHAVEGAIQGRSAIVIVAPKSIHLSYWDHIINPRTVKLHTPYSVKSLVVPYNALILVDECFPEQLKALFEQFRENKYSMNVIEVDPKVKS